MSDWDRRETDCLFDLVQRFGLRFIVIADRFAHEYANNYEIGGAAQVVGNLPLRQARKDRTVDELKERYYTVCKEVLTLRGDKQNPIVVQPFNFEMEVRRKVNLEKIFQRTKDMIVTEKYHISQLKKIDSKIKKEIKEEKQIEKLLRSDLGEARQSVQPREQEQEQF